MYFDVLNWEKHDLLDIDLGIATVKSEYKKTAISFVQYVWIKMVEGLNSYGFSYDDIRAIRTKLGRKLHFSPYCNKKVASNKALETSYNNSEAYVTDFEKYVLYYHQHLRISIIFSSIEIPQQIFLNLIMIC